MEIILENWVVKLKKGMIRGCLKKEDDFNYYCFLGIRYGQAPKGDLRFKVAFFFLVYFIFLNLKSFFSFLSV